MRSWPQQLPNAASASFITTNTSIVSRPCSASRASGSRLRAAFRRCATPQGYSGSHLSSAVRSSPASSTGSRSSTATGASSASRYMPPTGTSRPPGRLSGCSCPPPTRQRSTERGGLQGVPDADPAGHTRPAVTGKHKDSVDHPAGAASRPSAHELDGAERCPGASDSRRGGASCRNGDAFIAPSYLAAGAVSADERTGRGTGTDVSLLSRSRNPALASVGWLGHCRWMRAFRSLPCVVVASS